MDARAEADCLRVAHFGPEDVLFFGIAAGEGRAQVWAVYDGPERIGSLVLTECEGALVVNVYAADGGGDTLPQVLRILETVASKRGLKSLRFWTRLPALARRAGAYGFTASHVLEKEITDGK
ncbi:MAG: hypothetical protein CSA72_08365 [Rhodobacterales bacterium]|nr:MAG: hypothetical protein CSA72_08365 [Rhodobacterales bacterium]